ncbi:hypothetical protein R1flu_027084 [Riccia fluitans]|uniref:Uncharacterized protein n=1 Tax=Riccia fluitans TaxID=41844 RepID=A0ABD1XHU0_9MARC
MAADKRKSPGSTDKKKSSGNSGDKQKGNGGVSQSDQKLRDQAMEELRKQYFQARAAIPPQIPKFFNLQIDEWNMNQYGSMMPDVERSRMMRKGEWLGLALPHQDYDHDAYMAEIMPEFDDWRLKTMITEHNNQQVADKVEEERLRREEEEQLRVHEAEENAAAAKRAAEARATTAAALAEKKEKERIIAEAELDAVAAGPVSADETPQVYRRRVQLRQFRNQVERLRMKAKLAGKATAFETPSLPPIESDFYQPLPKGIYGSIQMPASRNPSESAGNSQPRGDRTNNGWEVTKTFTAARAMEHQPQEAETHYFDPEASTRLRSEHWNGDPYQTTHPYLGKATLSGPKYANWSPHPYLCDLDTLQQRFGSWRGTKVMEIEPQVNAGNLRGERIRLGWGATECGNLRYPPVGLCNEQQFVCRVDYSKSGKDPCFAECPAGIKLSGANPSWPTTSRPGMSWYTTQGLKPEYRPEPHTLKPLAPSAGVSTERNVPLAYRNHPRCLMDPNLNQIVLTKTMGQFVPPHFRPQPGDILILQKPRQNSTKSPSYLVFKTLDEDFSHHFIPGDQIVRIGKFVNGRWKLTKHFKMFKLVEGRRWMIIGLLDNDRKLIPIQKPCHQKVSTVVLGFWPRRGDLLLKAVSLNDPSQLDWVVVPVTGPAFKPHPGDVNLRVYTSKPRPGLGEMAGSVEMYVYDGAGMGWVFMGRDDCLLDSEGRET